MYLVPVKNVLRMKDIVVHKARHMTNTGNNEERLRG